MTILRRESSREIPDQSWFPGTYPPHPSLGDSPAPKANPGKARQNCCGSKILSCGCVCVWCRCVCVGGGGGGGNFWNCTCPLDAVFAHPRRGNCADEFVLSWLKAKPQAAASVIRLIVSMQLTKSGEGDILSRKHCAIKQKHSCSGVGVEFPCFCDITFSFSTAHDVVLISKGRPPKQNR